MRKKDAENQPAKLLIKTIQELSLARDLETMRTIVKNAARKITEADGVTFILRENDRCYYMDEDAISPLWKGKRFPQESCISGWVMQHRKPAIIKDIEADGRIPMDVYKSTFVKSLAMVPIRSEDPLGAIGIYWADKRSAGAEEMEFLQSLADSTAIAMENIEHLNELHQTMEELRVHYTEKEKTLASLQKEKSRAAASERKVNDIIKHANIGIAMADPHGNIMDANPVFVNLLGYGKKELISKNFSDFTHPEDLEKEQEMIEEVKRKEREYYRVEKRYITKDERIKWVDLVVAAHRNLQENIELFIGMVFDITETRLARESLLESEALYRHYFEAAPYAIFIADPHTLSDPNPRASELFGYSAEELEKLTPYDLSPPTQPDGSSSKEKAICYLNEAMAGKMQSFEWVHKRKNGSLFDAQVSLRRVEKDGKPKIMAILLDITDRKEYVRELQQKNRFIQTILDNLPIGLALNKFNEGSTTYMNKRFTEIYGWQEEELTDISNFFNKVYPDKKYREEITNRIMKDMNSGDPAQMHWENITITRKDGQKRIINAVNIPMVEQNTMVSTVMDVTELKQAEHDLLEKNREYESLNEELQQTNEEVLLAKEQAEKSDQLKTVFLNNMSHEIRTPMNGIMGFSRLLENPDLEDDKRNYYIRIIRNSGEQLLRVIDDILKISELETKQVTMDESEVCLNDLMMEVFSVFELQSKERNLHLQLNKALSDADSTIMIDRGKLLNVINNLVENALKYTPEGFVEIGYTLDQNTLILYVKDTGIGISPENQEKIFERFVQEETELTRHTGGLGIGLSIAKENIELLGGALTIESAKGDGSTFCVRLPYKPASGKRRGDRAGRSGTTRKKNRATILVVEDEEMNYLYIEELLKEDTFCSYHLLHARTGEEALNRCRNDRSIDLVLLDIKLPGMSGHDVVREIRTFDEKILVIAQTAYSTPGDKKLALEAGCNEFLTKPISKESLMAAIREYFPHA